MNSPNITENNASIKNDNSVIYVINVNDNLFLLPGDATEVTLGVDSEDECK